MTPREDDLYAQVIEIAQEQARSSTAMAELHRQNVSKGDTMVTLLTAQTSSLVVITSALQSLSASYDRSHGEMKKHVTDEFKARELKFWLFLAVVALTGSSDTILKLAGLLRG